MSVDGNKVRPRYAGILALIVFATSLVVGFGLGGGITSKTHQSMVEKSGE